VPSHQLLLSAASPPPPYGERGVRDARVAGDYRAGGCVRLKCQELTPSAYGRAPPTATPLDLRHAPPATATRAPARSSAHLAPANVCQHGPPAWSRGGLEVPPSPPTPSWQEGTLLWGQRHRQFLSSPRTVAAKANGMCTTAQPASTVHKYTSVTDLGAQRLRSFFEQQSNLPRPKQRRQQQRNPLRRQGSQHSSHMRKGESGRAATAHAIKRGMEATAHARAGGATTM